jgi:predicted O-methyltransferase YrrM
VKRALLRLLRAVSPRGAAWAEERWRGMKLSRAARALRRRCDRAPDLAGVVDEVLACAPFPAVQKRGEILPLLALVERSRPRRLCEIGAAAGGTLALLARVAAPDARLLSIDLHYAPARMRSHPRLAGPGQRITCLRADSQLGGTVAAVRRWLDGDALDVLFIDGDHSLAGVASDYDLYAPFVRPGGIIAFHDIVPDFKTRHGIVTGSDVGEVPAFWRDLKARGVPTRELVEDPEQDGFGIGVVVGAGEQA